MDGMQFTLLLKFSSYRHFHLHLTRTSFSEFLPLPHQHTLNEVARNESQTCLYLLISYCACSFNVKADPFSIK
jgi:hypothetical protein